MTIEEEKEFADIARRMADTAKEPGWEAMRYMAIGRYMEQLATFCAVCDCQVKKSGNTK